MIKYTLALLLRGICGSSLLLSFANASSSSGSSSLQHGQQTMFYQLPQQSDEYGFEEMSKLIKRLDVLEKDGPEMLQAFYDPSLKTFSLNPGDSSNKNRVCVSSTCYALLTLSMAEHEALSPSSNSNSPPALIRRALKQLMRSNWRDDDLLQVPLLLYTFLKVDSDRSVLRFEVAASKEVAKRIANLVMATLKARPHRHAGLKQDYSDYIIYQVSKVAALLQCQYLNSSETPGSTQASFTSTPRLGGLPSKVLEHLPQNAASEVYWALLRCAEVSCNELCRQLAYRTAGDSHSFDVIRLAYSLLTYLRSTDALSDLAGKEMVPGEGPSPETQVPPLNEKLVQAALAAFFEEQSPNGLWDKGQPIYKSFHEGKGRNIGNAFVFPVNTVGSLLCALPAEYFRPHLAALERTLGWIESHETLEVIADYTDPETGQCYGKPLRGWSSPLLDPETKPQAWGTAQVLKCVTWMKIRISQLMHNDVLEEFRGVRYSDQGIQEEAWDQLLDSDIGLGGSASRSNSTLGADIVMSQSRTLKSVLEGRVVVPFKNSINNPSYGAAYSAILFGPPGTAKTTICEALAQRMGYDFCVIDTAAFLADGLTNVSARIRYVFTRLMALRKCVILFDEIEEFALDRETPGLSMESRMLTTAMLTAINDLRRCRQSIFFCATNRLKAFDSAITRPGRFDMQLFVGTPNLEARVIQFEEQLRSNNGSLVEEALRAKAVQTFREFLDSVWMEDLMFMNYLEGMQFAAACADIVANDGRNLHSEELHHVLRQQAAVMTVRGSARDEYLASMGQSRL